MTSGGRKLNGINYTRQNVMISGNKITLKIHIMDSGINNHASLTSLTWNKLYKMYDNTTIDVVCIGFQNPFNKISKNAVSAK